MADLAAQAARLSGLGDQAVTLIRRAGLVHDLGRLGVPNTIWDKRGPLGHADAERVRLHPYLTERMLVCSPALAPLAAVAVQHHERLDGSGYPRGLSGGALSPEGRILAAADFYHVADRTATAPGCLRRRRGRQPPAGRGAGRPAGRRRGRRGAVRGGPSGHPQARPAGRDDRS